MHKFTEQDMAEALAPVLTGRPASFAGCGSICTDTRKLERGDVFLGLRGGNSPEVAAQAEAKGALALVLSCGYSGSLPCCRVSDTEKALSLLGSYQRARHMLPCIGVTGSCGKTTTKNLLGSILRTMGDGLVTEGNLNNALGVPMTLLRLEESMKWAVVEMGMNHKGEIAALTALTKPQAAVITNTGTAHIEYLGSRENIALAKAEIFRGMQPGSKAALNCENDCFPLLAKEAKLRNLEIVSFGKGGDVCFEILEESLNGLRGILKTPKGEIELLAPCFGTYQSQNIAGAAAGALCLLPELTLDNLAAGIAGAPQEKLRNEIRSARGVTGILDCYNANLDSMLGALDTLRRLAWQGRKAVLLGDMLELGETAPKAHEKAGRLAAQSCDLAFFIGSYASSYMQGAKAEKTKCACQVVTESDAAEILKGSLVEGDALLIKGSRGAKLERFWEEIV